MLRLAFTFLLIGVVAALLGFTSIAGISIAFARIFAFLFLAMFIILVVLGLNAARHV